MSASASKLVMYKKLCNVQRKLMNEKTPESLEVLIPVIFKKCLEENMTFWFSFLEDAAVLNLRDIQQENYELNIRYAYQSIPVKAEEIDSYKVNLLINAFLLTTGEHPIEVNLREEVKSSAKKSAEKKTAPQITIGNTVPPTSIRTVIDVLEKNNEPVNSKTIEKHLQLNKMSQDNRRRCIAYLRDMKKREASA